MKPKTLASIKRVKLHDTVPIDQPWVADLRTYDIPETIAACIRNAAPDLVAITLSPHGGPRMIRAAEHAARKRGIRILWWDRPFADKPKPVAPSPLIVGNTCYVGKTKLLIVDIHFERPGHISDNDVIRVVYPSDSMPYNYVYQFRRFAVKHEAVA